MFKIIAVFAALFVSVTLSTVGAVDIDHTVERSTRVVLKKPTRKEGVAKYSIIVARSRVSAKASS